ncbi:DMT family transporter [Pseudemcibacter aquimaris]|uniref:DMT family transporter n=1 Tax=Pseudemcibacter aquimaris TaxID=2857064 RepID=UPI00201326C6|nr:DMT family transporter [Pseudemcibacter aquimaris]MCC3862234.1 DMT family transporter [Pseudemcibacter aquimaris]WDU58986.1 DMT family transporter [Pseudemcibacter aquimaris]
MTKKELLAILIALSACVIWSGNFVIAQGVNEWIKPFTLAFWRWLVAFIFILPIGLKATIKEWHLVRDNWKFMVVMGIIGIGFYNTLIYFAGQFTTTHHIAIVSATAPIGTLVIAGIMGVERLSRYKVLGAICAFIGALMVVTHGNPLTVFSQDWNNGDIILIFSTLIWAAWSVAITFKPKEMSTRTFLTAIMGIGTLFLLPCYLWEATYVAPTPFTLEAWGIYAYVGIMASVVAWFAWQYSVDNIGSVKTSLIYYSMPVFSGILAIIILDEPVETYHIIGFVLVCSGIIISNLRKLGIVKEK